MVDVPRAGGMAIENGLGGVGLGLEHRPVGNVAVPFDQGRDRAGAFDNDVIELPDRV
jgi:hypothetical protein